MLSKQEKREHHRKYMQEWRKKNRNKIRERERENTYRWRYLNREKYKIQNRLYQKRYREKNPEYTIVCRSNRRVRISQNGGKFSIKEWKELKQKYKNTCLCCLKSEPNIQIVADHIIPVKLGGTGDISNIQPLCISCNLKKNIKIIDYRGGENDE